MSQQTQNRTCLDADRLRVLMKSKSWERSVFCPCAVMRSQAVVHFERPDKRVWAKLLLASGIFMDSDPSNRLNPKRANGLMYLDSRAEITLLARKIGFSDKTIVAKSQKLTKSHIRLNSAESFIDWGRILPHPVLFRVLWSFSRDPPSIFWHWINHVRHVISHTSHGLLILYTRLSKSQEPRPRSLNTNHYWFREHLPMSLPDFRRLSRFSVVFMSLNLTHSQSFSAVRTVTHQSIRVWSIPKFTSRFSRFGPLLLIILASYLNGL
jgi:hypothetical protein